MTGEMGAVRHFADRVVDGVRRVGNPVVVGIDPRPEWLPESYRIRRSSVAGVYETIIAIESFCRHVVDVVAGRVCAIKAQCAFFERFGPQGMAALAKIAEYARRQALMVIYDGKRNDIGATAQAYAEAYVSRTDSVEEVDWYADALTINPYLGSDGITPFADASATAGKGVFVLVRTSNASAGDFQDLVCDGRPLYRHVAERLAEWAQPHRGESGYSLVGAVVGATYPRELAELRAALPGVIFLVPGYGAQGGAGADVAAAFDANGLGALVNNSRGLVFAHQRPEYRDRFGGDWQRALEAALEEMMADLAANTPAGKLRA
jgi:orotidine-5'-phosphate decarboxylase